MKTNVNTNVNDIMNFINVIRNLDDEGVAIVSSAIAANMQTRKSARKSTLSLVK